MEAHTLTLALVLASYVLTAIAALTAAIAMGALESRVRIDAEVRIIPRPCASQAITRRVSVARVTPVYSVRTRDVMLAKAFAALMAEMERRDRLKEIAASFQFRRFVS